MTNNGNRLSEKGLPAELAAPVIDRGKAVGFTLDGRAIVAFEGDTVLSAALANGKAAAGIATGSPLALDFDSAPAVWLAGEQDRACRAMPMALCPATEGIKLVTSGPGSPSSRFGLRRPFAQRHGLGLKYGICDPRPGGWFDAEPTQAITTGIIVVGAGVAGLSAALAAADRGLDVVLIDREPVVGGLSMMFGRAEGEPNPEDMIASLASSVERSGRISLHLDTDVFDLSGTTVRAVRVTRIDGRPQTEHLAITGTMVILATGLAGRLPIFPGNRLPGVVGAATAWRLAARYNVWPGRSSHVHTGTNVGYRMALLGAASGKTIARTTDPRIAPETRFIEFCKAYGHRLGWGTAIASATARRDGQLDVQLSDSQRGIVTQDSLVCDRLIVSAGWQPRIDLWMQAGGAVHWDARSQRLLARGSLDGIALAGAVAGYRSLAGCSDHGAAALETALGDTPASVLDPQIDPAFETPDANLPVSRTENAAAPAYVSARRIAHFSRRSNTKWNGFLSRREQTPDLAPVAHGALDVAGAALAGLIPEADIARFSAERCISPIALTASVTAPMVDTDDDASGNAIPPYLARRFGKTPELRRIVPAVARALSPGCMVFTGHRQTSPQAAIGVVMSQAGQEPSILVGTGNVKTGDSIHVRDGLVTVQARVGEVL